MRNFYTFKFRLLTSHRFPCSLILAWKLLHSPSLCIPTPLTTLLSKRTRTRTQKTTSDIPEWFSGNHDKLLVLQNGARDIYTLGFSTPNIKFGSRPISLSRSRAPGNAWPNPSIHCSCLWQRMIANTTSSCVPQEIKRLCSCHSGMVSTADRTTGVGVTSI